MTEHGWVMNYGPMSKSNQVMAAIVRAFKESGGQELMGSTLRDVVIREGMQPWPGATLVGKMVKSRMLEVTKHASHQGPGKTWRCNYRLLSSDVPEKIGQGSPTPGVGMVLAKAEADPGKFKALPEAITQREIDALRAQGFTIRVFVRVDEGA